MSKVGGESSTKCLCVLLAAVSLLVSWRPAAAGEARVAVAASASGAAREIADAFARDAGHAVKLSVGSSGNLTRQIARGAPFEVFLSADEDFVGRLVGQALTEGRGDVYAVGRLVLFTPTASRVRLTADLSTLTEDVRAGRLKRLAIANPDHAPYGVIAKAALVAGGVWNAVAPKIVLGDNAVQTAQFAIAGSVEAALLPFSLVRLPRIAERGRHVAVSERLYAPLRQRMVLLRGAGPVAREFYRFMGSEPARRILARNGFRLPARKGRGAPARD